MDKIKPKFMHAYASYSKTSFVKGCSKIYWVEVEGIQTDCLWLFSSEFCNMNIFIL